jgi:hypothetical protein
VHLGRDDRLPAGTSELWAAWRPMRVVTRSECTDQRTAQGLIVRAEHSGKAIPDGVCVVVSVRTLALALGISIQRGCNSLRCLDAAGFLRMDYDGRARDKARGYVLCTGRALRKPIVGGYAPREGKARTGREATLSDASSDYGVYAALR